jgi:hypothetical protein
MIMDLLAGWQALKDLKGRVLKVFREKLEIRSLLDY